MEVDAMLFGLYDFIFLDLCVVKTIVYHKDLQVQEDRPIATVALIGSQYRAKGGCLSGSSAYVN